MSHMMTAWNNTGSDFISNQVHNQKNRRGGNEMNEMVMENKQVTGLKFPKMSLREAMKNEKGLTLIELLAVIVIIAIIAAIAIPSIGSIMEKTRKNAHRTNAHMAIDAARLYMTNEGVTLTSTRNTVYISLQELHDKGYLQTIPVDPSNKPNTYTAGAAWGATGPVTTAPASTSYVMVTNAGATAGTTSANYAYSANLHGLVTYIADTVAENEIDATTVNE